MIVPMKHVAVLCTASSEDETLDALQSLGVLHIEASGHRETSGLKEAQASLDAAAKALSILKDSGCVANGSKASPEDVLAAKARIEDISARIAANELAAATYAPFGDFSPDDLRELSANGLALSLFRAAADAVPESGGGLVIRILAEDAKEKLAYGVAIGPFEPTQGVEVLPLPEKPVSDIRAETASLTASLDAERQALAGMGTEAISDELVRRTSVRDFMAASASMDSDSGVKWLEGYLPEPRLQALSAAAREHGWGVAVRDPSEDETPPTLVEPPKAFRPILPLFSMLGVLPGYRETDVSVVFYSFFTLFFAMLIGDAGYGLLILALTLLARRKFPKAPREPFILMGVLSAATIGWGILTANYFGILPEALPAWMRFRTTSWLANQSNIMQLCFVIGAVHLTIARLWNAALLYPSRKALAELGWVGVVWTMFCVASLVIVEGFVFPRFMFYVAGVSVLMIALFMLDKSELKTNGVQLGMLPLNIVSGLGDIISYVRLYAVGLSSVIVAQNFNTMAMDLNLPLWAKIPCVILILLLGHGLNLAMGALSILVHAVRLNTLEFSNAKGITWSGYDYRPFRK